MHMNVNVIYFHDYRPNRLLFSGQLCKMASIVVFLSLTVTLRVYLLEISGLITSFVSCHFHYSVLFSKINYFEMIK